MIRLLFLIAILLSITYGEITPTPSKYDQRITFVTYNPDDVFNIYVKDGYTTILEFDKEEQVLLAGSGFNPGWEITKFRNELHIRAKAYMAKYGQDDTTGKIVQYSEIVEPNPQDWNTNLFITTNKRTYIADLRLGSKRVQYKISFRYPKESFFKKAAKKAKERALAEQKLIKKDLEHPAVPRNWAYFIKVNKNSNDIKPSFVYDDGVFTYIGFAPNKTFPTAFLREGDKESILNTHIKKIGEYDVLVIHRLAKLILLRSGKKLVGILNNGYNKNPFPWTRETTNVNVKREIKNAKK